MDMQDKKTLVILLVLVIALIGGVIYLLMLNGKYKEELTKKQVSAEELDKKENAKEKENNNTSEDKNGKVDFTEILKEFIGDNGTDELLVKENFIDEDADGQKRNGLYEARLGIGGLKTLHGKKPKENAKILPISELEKRNQNLMDKMKLDRVGEIEYSFNNSLYENQEISGSSSFSFEGKKTIDGKVYEVSCSIYYYPSEKADYCTDTINGVWVRVVEHK